MLCMQELFHFMLLCLFIVKEGSFEEKPFREQNEYIGESHCKEEMSEHQKTRGRIHWENKLSE